MSMRRLLVPFLAIAGLASTATAQLAPSWIIPATAHSPGSAGSFWASDISLHNPHEYSLPVVVHLLPSNRENWSAPAIDIELYPWETFNLWDALGPDVFAHQGTAALLIYAAPELDCSDLASCDFLVSSRTYTPGAGGNGEYGQAIPGLNTLQGLDWDRISYTAGILNDGAAFRTNVGVASWTEGWTTVRMDVQDSAGNIVDTQYIDVPPFGHVQFRLDSSIEGGSLVFLLEDGVDDSLVFPYASVVNQITNDPSFFATLPSVVGLDVPKARSELRRTAPRAEAHSWQRSPQKGRPTR